MHTTSKTNKPIRKITANIFGIVIVIGTLSAAVYASYLLYILLQFFMIEVPSEQLWSPKKNLQTNSSLLSTNFIYPIITFACLILAALCAYISHSRLKASEPVILSLLGVIFLGVIFISAQLYYNIHTTSLFSNAGLYSSTFMMMIGIHGLFIAAGILYAILMIIFVKTESITIDNSFALKATTWHWYFVVGFWIIIFLFMYWVSYG